MSNEKQTAVEWFYESIKKHFEHDAELLEKIETVMWLAKNNERVQHGNTWDSAIQAHEDRGHVLARSSTDFDEYEIH